MRVTDLGLARLTKLEKLQHLDVSGSAITSNGLKALANLRDLRRLSLWNVKGIDDTAAARTVRPETAAQQRKRALTSKQEGYSRRIRLIMRIRKAVLIPITG